ncbi:hypothetical protein JTB14_012025 [Gonioctena quinquepunctata]|nr:hypothetical protein JTB14_012025 [Gonioctena quinquepunctata]
MELSPGGLYIKEAEIPPIVAVMISVLLTTEACMFVASIPGPILVVWALFHEGHSRDVSAAAGWPSMRLLEAQDITGVGFAHVRDAFLLLCGDALCVKRYDSQAFTL